MVKEPLYLPGDKQELFDRYLDKTAHADLIERLRVITGALQNKLTPQKLRLHRIDRTDAITLFHERTVAVVPSCFVIVTSPTPKKI